MKKDCECCGNKIKIVFPLTKYCNKCSVHIFNLCAENRRLRNTLERRENKIKVLQRK